MSANFYYLNVVTIASIVLSVHSYNIQYYNYNIKLLTGCIILIF